MVENHIGSISKSIRDIVGMADLMAEYIETKVRSWKGNYAVVPETDLIMVDPGIMTSPAYSATFFRVDGKDYLSEVVKYLPNLAQADVGGARKLPLLGFGTFTDQLRREFNFAEKLQEDGADFLEGVVTSYEDIFFKFHYQANTPTVKAAKRLIDHVLIDPSGKV